MFHFLVFALIAFVIVANFVYTVIEATVNRKSYEILSFLKQSYFFTTVMYIVLGSSFFVVGISIIYTVRKSYW